MHFITTLGQRWKESWKRATVAVLTVVLLSGVAVGGLALAGSDAFASLKASEGPLTLDAPTSTLLRLQAKTGSAPNGKVVLLKDWQSTAISFTPGTFTQDPFTGDIHSVAQVLSYDAAELGKLVGDIGGDAGQLAIYIFFNDDAAASTAAFRAHVLGDILSFRPVFPATPFH